MISREDWLSLRGGQIPMEKAEEYYAIFSRKSSQPIDFMMFMQFLGYAASLIEERMDKKFNVAILYSSNGDPLMTY